ncbi:MAG: GAF domain-containing protein, partial [Chloroflexi bacterium]|nr:GAF domain-containing protein [Chloroflexota bacterium]
LRRVDQFAALVETTRDIALQSDLASLLELIVGHAIRLLGASRGTMYLYDPVRNQVELTVEQGGFNKIKTRLEMGEGVAGRVALTRQSLIVDDYRAWENRSAQFDGLPIRAVMGVPMLFGGELLGVLIVSEVGSAERKFNEGDARLLSLFAGQAASTVHNARLIEETRVRAEQLTMVYDAGLTLNRVLDLNVQLEFLLQTAMRALRAERAEIFLWDAAQRHSEMKFALGFTPERLREMQAARFPLDPEKSLLGWVIENHLPLNVPDVFADPRYIVIDPEIQSMLFVPVQHEQQLRGVLAALSTRRDAFSAQDERLLILFSNQVAVAMENARLFADARQRVQELTLINQISATINQPLALADVLNNTLRELARALKVDRAGLAVLAENRRHLTVIAEYNALPGSTAQGEKIPVADNPSMEFILRERRPLAVSDVSTDPMLASVAPLLRQVGALSILILPLVVNDQVIGTIGLDSTRAVRVFTDAEIALAQTIANQALGTIERARLLEQMERHAAQLSAVNELGRAVAETVDRAQIFQRVYEAARRIFPDTATMFISLYDSARQTIAGVFGMQDDQPVNVAELPVIPLLPPGEGTQSQVIHTRASLIVNDLNAQLKDAPVVVYVGTEGDQTRSAVYAPMLSKGNVIGVIQIQSYALERYQPADAELLSVIANSAAIAIENAQLFNETQRRLEQMQALRVVDLAIKGSLDLKLTLSVLLEQ